MKRIIGGKRYDTDTATEIASWGNGARDGDFNRCSETLFVTKAGAFFLCGSGGAMSKYARSYQGGRSRGGGEEIIPMSRDEAIVWCENREETECLETHFADGIMDA
jgi:hypothetical protein